MVDKLKHIVLVFFVSCIQSYGQNFVSYVSVNHESAYIGQPIQLTVSVYTNTWFTSGIDVGNIQVEGALTVYFRSVSNSRDFSGKKYAGVDFIYNIFPTKAGEIIIPELTIHVESPKPGDYKGLKHVIKTKQKSININDVPVGYDPNNWLVSSSLNITEKWNISLNNVNVGDVLQRTISRSAAGTLSEFIPAQQWDSVQGVSIYPTRPKTETHKSKTAVSAKRIETVNYLFEKEGEIILPKIEFIYWNFYNKKFFKKVIDSTVIQVAPNADLEMLASIKKQLEQDNQEPELLEDKPFLIFGFTLKQFLLITILCVIGFYILIRLIKRIFNYSKKRYEKYLDSEKYYFNKVSKSLKHNDAHTFMRHLTVWTLRLNINEHNFDYFLKTYGTQELKSEYQNLKIKLYDSRSKVTTVNYQSILISLKASRKKYLTKSIKHKSYSGWLNPIN